MLQNNSLSFHPYADIDWDADLSVHIKNVAPNLDADEQVILQFLQKRGASFLTSAALKIEQPLQTVLFSLMEKSLIHSDSFTPVRIWLERAKSEKLSPRRKTAAIAAMTSAGRWDIVRPLKLQNIEERLAQAFDKTPILSHETAAPLLGVSWAAALEALRIWEYTGRARRGYFVEGLSGAQYIREDAYVSAIQGLRSPADKIIWLTATDPNQVWGKVLPYDADRKFTSVPGTVIALKQGVPVAIFERKGHTLRVFDEGIIENGTLADALTAFAEAFRKKNIFTASNYITVKQYPPEAAQSLKNSGFEPVMLDYVLYR